MGSWRVYMILLSVISIAITTHAFHFSMQLQKFLQHSMNDDTSIFQLKSQNDEGDTLQSKLNQNIMNAAAELTTSTSSLLGVKSVGVDYGLVRTGIGLTIGYEPKPIAIVSDMNNTELCQYIIKLAEIENADQIIVGLPFHKNGTEAEQTIITRDFATHLNCAVYAHFGPDKMPVFMFDERYTSKEAAARIRSENPRANLYKELDADAACIILEYYYLDNGVGAHRVELPEDETVRDAIQQAWLLRKQEQERKRKEMTEQRMISSQDRKKAMMEKARLLEEKLAIENGAVASKKKKKRKKKR